MFRRDVLKAAAAAATGATLLTADATTQANAARPRAASNRPDGHFIAASDGTQLFFRDWGSGPPIVFLGAWGLPSESWSYVMLPACEAGARCVSYDRRGHGRSGDPGRGFDYDTLSDDLAAVLEALDLSNVTLVAHSMSGGEAIRYLTRHGSRRIARLVLVATTLPCLARSADNPQGIEPAVFDHLRQTMIQDYPKWLQDNSRPFVTPETSQPLMDWGMGLMRQTSLKALLDCNRAMTAADFRADLGELRVPALVIHGDRDASAPLALCGSRAASLIPGARLEVYAGGPHGLPLTHAPRLSKDILDFARG